MRNFKQQIAFAIDKRQTFLSAPYLGQSATLVCVYKTQVTISCALLEQKYTGTILYLYFSAVLALKIDAE